MESQTPGVSGAYAKPVLRTRAKFLVLAASCVLALLLAELGLRLIIPVDRLVASGIDDRSWIYRWMKERDANKAAGQLTIQNMMMFSPTLGWRPKPFAGRDSFTLNSRGYRGGREYSTEKAAGERRIVVVGDSYTFAGRYDPILPAIRDDEIYTAVVERGLPRSTVINLGVPGYATDQMLVTLDEEGWRYQPDIVIVTLFVDNLYRSLLNFRDYAKPRFDLDGGRLVKRNVPIPPPEELEGTLSRRPPLSYAWMTARVSFRRLANQIAPMGWMEVDRVNFAILNAFQEEVARRHAKLLVVMIPSPELDPRPHRSERIVEAWSRKTGVPLLLLRDPFLALPPENQAKLYLAHLTPYGHAVTGEAILASLRRHRLVE